MCFDKTGTLTEDGLDLYGLRPVTVEDSKNKYFNLYIFLIKYCIFFLI